MMNTWTWDNHFDKDTNCYILKATSDFHKPFSFSLSKGMDRNEFGNTIGDEIFHFLVDVHNNSNYVSNVNISYAILMNNLYKAYLQAFRN